jgi:hypothetical protein
MTELDEQERYVWFGFLLLAGDCAHEGRICATENSGYTDIQLADLLKTNPELIKKAKRKFLKYGKIEIDENGIILICKWHLYQSEYFRQKSYRVKLQDEVTNSSLSLSSSISPSGLEKTFDEWWERYPRKIAKKVAAKAYAATIKAGAEPEDLLRAVDGYIAELRKNATEEKFIKHPSTFLHEERWRDYLDRPVVLEVGESGDVAANVARAVERNRKNFPELLGKTKEVT